METPVIFDSATLITTSHYVYIPWDEMLSFKFFWGFIQIKLHINYKLFSVFPISYLENNL